MKSLICSLVFILVVSFSYGQYPITQNLGSATTLVQVPANGGLRANLIVRTYTDTTSANAGYSDSYAGALIYTTSDNSYWVRNAATTKWFEVYTSGGTGTTPTLQLVTDAGNTTTNNLIVNSGLGTLTRQSGSSFEFRNTVSGFEHSISVPTVTANRNAYLQDTTGTLAYLHDITGTRFGVSGEDATSTQNRTFTTSGYQFQIYGQNGSKQQLFRFTPDSVMGIYLRENPSSADLAYFYINGSDSSANIKGGRAVHGSGIAVRDSAILFTPWMGIMNIDSIRSANSLTRKNVLIWDSVGGGLYQTPISSISSLSGSGTTNYVTKWTGTGALGNSQIFDDGSFVGVGTASPTRLFQVGSLDPVVSLKQTTSAQEYSMRIGTGSGLSSQTWNIYDNSNSKYLLSGSGNRVIIGNPTSAYAASTLYVKGYGSNGSNIDAQPDSTVFDEGNIEIMKSDYSNGEGIAMRQWGNVGTAGTVLGYTKKNMGLLDFTNNTNIIRTLGNYSLRFGTNNTERMVLDSNGRLGIGLTAPTSALDVLSTATTGTGLNLASSTITSGALATFTNTGTGAASNTKKVLSIVSSGANATASQTVTGQTISVTNTGTTNTNVGLSIATTGGSTMNNGIVITGANGEGIFRTRSTTAGVNRVQIGDWTGGGYGSNLLFTRPAGGSDAATISHNNTNLEFYNDIYGGFRFIPAAASTGITLSGTATTTNDLSITNSTLTSGSAASIALTGTAATSNTKTGLSITSSGANATASQTVTGQTISVTNTGTTSTNVGLNVTASGGTNNYAALFTGNVGIGTTSPTTKLHVAGRAASTQGADVASTAGVMTLGSDGNSFEITGTNTITAINNTNWINGSEVILLFTSTAVLTDGTANSGTSIGMELAGNVNFTASAGATIKLILAEIGGTQRWYEVSRSIN